MVKNIVLLDTFGLISDKKYQKEAIGKYIKYIKGLTTSFRNTKIKFRKLRNFDKRVEIAIEGPEEIFVYNYLSKEMGVIKQFSGIQIGDALKGRLLEVGKVGFGIFVDCGVFSPNIEPLLSLNTLRRQLGNNKKISLSNIIKTFDFIDNAPVWVRVIDKNEIKNQLEVEMDTKYLDFYYKIINEDIEGLFVIGETKSQLKRSLESTGHYRDIVFIEKFGFLDHLLLLKKGTEAPGIISDIGKRLRAKFSVLKPNRIKEMLGNGGPEED